MKSISGKLGLIVTWLGVVSSALAQPQLSISNATNHVTVSWNASSNTYFTLEQTEYLQSPQWFPLLGSGSGSVTLPKEESARFFRLRQSPSNMVYIPPGTFTMGSSTNEVGHGFDEIPLSQVTISQGFWMGIYEVRQAEFDLLTGTGTSTTAMFPTQAVEATWFDATNYCALLTDRERNAGRLSTNLAYRLPTEAEWEYACRAGTTTAFSFGDDPEYTNLVHYAWFRDNQDPRGIKDSGLKRPNPWGLYDMHGNTYEWCWDWYNASLPGNGVTDPTGPPIALNKVRRGGGRSSRGSSCRSANRARAVPRSTSGFRIILARSGFFQPIPPPATHVLVPSGAIWSFLDDGSEPPADWTSISFDDSSWGFGPSELGYGDGDEATTVEFGPDSLAKFPTTFFRHAFTLTNASAMTNLTIRLLRDDGAIVYLNGTEVIRDNMPPGQISNQTLASLQMGGLDETTYLDYIGMPASLLINGTNVLAAEVHQGAPDSSDLTFDLELYTNELPQGD